MAEDWAAIAAEVAGAIGEVGYSASLIQPGTPTGPAYDPTPGADIVTAITIIDDTVMVSDRPAASDLLGKRTIIIATQAGMTPRRGDKIQVAGEQPAEIEEIRPLRPGGVVLLWEVDLAR